MKRMKLLSVNDDNVQTERRVLGVVENPNVIPSTGDEVCVSGEWFKCVGCQWHYENRRGQSGPEYGAVLLLERMK